MELKATIKQLHDVVDKGTFKSRKVWVETRDNPQYPQTIEIELQQDKVDMLNNVAIGAEVVLYLNIRGREWTSKEGQVKVFNTLVCWKCVAANQVRPTPASMEGFNDDLPDDSGEKLPF